MNQTEDLRVRRTRKWLKAALNELMQEKPYARIKVSEIVQRAEVSRPTFYLHYDSKDRLLLDLFEDIFAEFRDALEEEFSEDDFDPYRIGEILISSGERHKETLKILFHAGVSHLVEIQFKSILAEIAEKPSAYLSAIRDADLIPYIIEFFTSGIIGMLERWVQDDPPVPAELLGDMIGETALAAKRFAEGAGSSI